MGELSLPAGFMASGKRPITWIAWRAAALLALLLLGAAAAYQVDPPQPAPDLSTYPWLYQREAGAGTESNPLDDESLVELVAVGDVMLGRGVAGQPEPLQDAAPWLRSADLALGNFEGVITPPGMMIPDPPGDSPEAPLVLNVAADAARILRAAGFDLLGLANNHALDLGQVGLEETIRRLRSAGIHVLGTDLGTGEAYQPLLRQVNGLRLAFLAFNCVPVPGGRGMPAWDAAQAANVVRAARPQADVVIVSVHWGYEYQARPDPAQREMAQALLEAGADIILGHHPHVVQGTQVRPAAQGMTGRDQFVAYSLGNFVFDQYGEETRQGLALRILLDQRGLRAVQALPLKSGPRPRLLPPDEAAALLERAKPPAKRLGYRCDQDACTPVPISQQATQAGLFWSGEIDLTGDGAPEKISRQGGQVTIYQDGLAAWRSPPEWHALDLALGDPNDDGRGELLLALLKADASGALRSHPFIVGYRGGIYRLLWGGSAVSDPIQELELGDLDGDGVQELVVLEARQGGNALTVWSWHGWGFSLSWRGPVGRYSDLVLLPDPSGEGPVVSVAEEW
ncbi:MAG: CapA family protein [Anaerolineales bacterium]|nr:CapA family protein [Anaerolineales bacterium]